MKKDRSISDCCFLRETETAEKEYRGPKICSAKLDTIQCHQSPADEHPNF